MARLLDVMNGVKGFSGEPSEERDERKSGCMSVLMAQVSNFATRVPGRV